ncbi:NADAR family protein [uncultured Thiothrix sp.]|uniref:NADAR family protein n=1 Tax=uncultured Thiothrix sp. TaxID=223185 RepID=UPI00260EA146|nr:NADAR family protein [uncultured Thiothrix sp.]
MVNLLTNRQQLLEYLRQGHSVQYLHFWGHTQKAETIDKSCLSQWFPASFMLDELHYPSAEHYMMAQKARLFSDEETFAAILASASPQAAKQLGRQVKNFDEERWQQYCFDYVVRGNLGKFSQNLALREFLLNTGEQVIVEASPYDRIWGIGMEANNPNANHPEHWRGQNLLGFALMQVRTQLRGAV